jgi:hypothetical protein
MASPIVVIVGGGFGGRMRAPERQKRARNPELDTMRIDLLMTRSRWQNAAQASTAAGTLPSE